MSDWVRLSAEKYDFMKKQAESMREALFACIGVLGMPPDQVSDELRDLIVRSARKAADEK